MARSTATQKSASIRKSSSRDQAPSWSTSIGARATSKLAPPFKCRDLPPRFSPGTVKFDMETRREVEVAGREAARLAKHNQEVGCPAAEHRGLLVFSASQHKAAPDLRVPGPKQTPG